MFGILPVLNCSATEVRTTRASALHGGSVLGVASTVGGALGGCKVQGVQQYTAAVSYTHLTLPTIV
eukprot:9370665-Alexandrium_andersonii.AAC.1